jgi:ferritin
MTKQGTLIEVQKLFDMYFQANSLLDSVVYSIDIDFNMPQFADFIHLQISHIMPLLADKLNDFGRLRGDKFNRGALEPNVSNYTSPYMCMYIVTEYFTKIEEQIDTAINMAIRDNMKMWEDFLRGFQVSEQSKYTHQINVFGKAIKSYEDDNILSSFNKDFKSYITI